MTEPGRGAVVDLAVVGHTNVGKTSLLRTLTRNERFGQVSARASTTRHVEAAGLQVDGETLLRLHDTPGLEDAMALLDYLDQLKAPGERPDGPAWLRRFLDGPEARGRFEQEAKVIRQLLASDAGLYVIDAREPLLPKYLDELEVLALCGKPIFALLNFVAAPEADARAWREGLARRGLHASLSFDSVTPPLDGEQRLYQSLALMLEHAAPQLRRLARDRAEQAVARRHSARHLVAELLIDVAALRRRVPPQASAVEAALGELRDQVRGREQACVDALLRLYRFSATKTAGEELPLSRGRWDEDLFHPDTLKAFGLGIGGGAMAGAAAGVGFDLMTVGASLGTGTLTGALLGGGAEAARRLGAGALGKLRGERVLSVEDPVLRVLALRQQALLRALEARGHAAQGALAVPPPAADERWRQGRLPAPLKRARAHPQWSSLSAAPRLEQRERQAQVQALAEHLFAAE
ncbi:DUF3482 domain-containing protein [Alkalilimnicola sp. S0819]|uniref:DUF3482 domain-containing protein n=1 Tax=Alkalilimnicola sp. S0819 TaxID=2613922 RepID=UPI00126151BF|nr:DUF3482 domain-containing protein [Alkalilimnicola sp. S0819]KAB7619676.1 GTPase/DUF3482 domain-containing protein [Alkalilimnicola sp. S0819]MPQ17532.1 DUF3482 domain-containing protein [Alkalilimnicola sp. S0819]